MKHKIEINKLKNGYIEAKLIDTITNNPIEFRICESKAYLNLQIEDWQKRFKLKDNEENNN